MSLMGRNGRRDSDIHINRLIMRFRIGRHDDSTFTLDGVISIDVTMTPSAFLAGEAVAPTLCPVAYVTRFVSFVRFAVPFSDCDGDVESPFPSP